MFFVSLVLLQDRYCHLVIYFQVHKIFVWFLYRYCARYEITNARKSCQLNGAKNPWAPELKKGATVCVECQELAMKKKLGVRCKGHGVYNKETRWNAITVAGCHGDWVMKTAWGVSVWSWKWTVFHLCMKKELLGLWILLVILVPDWKLFITKLPVWECNSPFSFWRLFQKDIITVFKIAYQIWNRK